VIVTISREAGSGGDQVARAVCNLLSFAYFDKSLMAEVARERGISTSGVVDFSEDDYRTRSLVDALLGRSAASLPTPRSPAEGEPRLLRPVDENMAVAFVTATIRALGNRGQVVVVGRGGQAILRGLPGVLHVRIVAPAEDRALRLVHDEGLTREAAAAAIVQRDRATAQYLRKYHGIDWSDPALYHLTINTSLFGIGPSAELIADAVKRLERGSHAGGSSGER